LDIDSRRASQHFIYVNVVFYRSRFTQPVGCRCPRCWWWHCHSC